MISNEKIREKVERIYDDLVAMRRHLHRHPELSFQEEKTGQFIQGILNQHEISFTGGWAGHGIVAIINGELEGEKVVAVRADMDALPILEKNEVDYASQNQGVMHACGHDVHTTSLLGAAILLQSFRGEFGGTVKLMFQPGEEKLPGGASIMIKEGVLADPKPDVILGLHVHPPLSVGKIGLKSGLYMASADELYLKVEGKGGHAALPQDGIDPVLLGSYIMTALQSIVARRSTPTIPSVLTFGKVWSDGGATNVIPNAVNYEGTFRTMDEVQRQRLHKEMSELVQKTAEAHGGKAKLEIKVGYPCLVNDEDVTLSVKKTAEAYLGEENVVNLPPRMTAEDFAYYTHEVPACFFRLGTGNVSKGITSPVHTDTFDIDEEALKVSAGIFCRLVIDQLSSH